MATKPRSIFEEVETAQKEILLTARRLADAGEITIGGAGGEEML